MPCRHFQAHWRADRRSTARGTSISNSVVQQWRLAEQRQMRLTVRRYCGSADHNRIVDSTNFMQRRHADCHAFVTVLALPWGTIPEATASSSHFAPFSRGGPGDYPLSLPSEPCEV